ncbi:MAG TPA: DNA methyltransferase, partial [Pyrinomonadaceae bacterium]|nr:DNA methyltransferase [Pyrinomonadaceae bacterium]
MSTAAAVKLRSIDWDFASSTTRNGLQTIHPYPAKFIPHIPRALINLFHPGDSSKILDPFCGSGTTLVEAMNSGVEAVGIDLSPLATLIAKVRTTPLTFDLRKIGQDVSHVAQERVANRDVSIPVIP